MPHDHPHDHPHDPSAPGGHPVGHNHDHASHLHSHLSTDDAAAELQALTAQFIDGFQSARDKAAYLKIVGVPLEIPSEEDGAPLKLIDVAITSQWRIGAASPAFGSAELSYLPYPGDLIKERVNCALVYVSLAERRDVDVREFLKPQLG